MIRQRKQNTHVERLDQVLGDAAAARGDGELPSPLATYGQVAYVLSLLTVLSRSASKVKLAIFSVAGLVVAAYLPSAQHHGRY